jgi:hypothetical protein
MRPRRMCHFQLLAVGLILLGLFLRIIISIKNKKIIHKLVGNLLQIYLELFILVEIVTKILIMLWAVGKTGRYLIPTLGPIVAMQIVSCPCIQLLGHVLQENLPPGMVGCLQVEIRLAKNFKLVLDVKVNLNVIGMTKNFPFVP